MHVCKSERPKTKDLSLSTENGFTLIELSIVIVIIGLIVAGVVGGQSLVKQSKIRNIIADIDKYKVAFNVFKLEYDKWPGDLNIATRYWGGDVQDGNANNAINFWPPGSNHEDLSVWEHLVRAELIPGTYNGEISGVRYSYDINAPRGPFEDTGYNIITSGGHYNKRGTQVTYASLTNNVFGFMNGPAIPVQIAKAIDDKIDDGEASTGRSITYRGEGVGNQCVTAHWSAPSADWMLSDTTKSCRMNFYIDLR
jgi:prepilin-type N-terminal cleavage/methylation domain-containing protein